MVSHTFDNSKSVNARQWVAVAIPCFNEAPALPQVINEWRNALPEAEILVFDNNSTDGSGQIAQSLGVRVVSVTRQGKGFVVRAMFAELIDRDAVVMADGDGTYPANAVHKLLEPVLSGQADMTVGARVPVAEMGAMSPIRGVGNILIRTAFAVVMGISGGDLLSGYRVFGPKFLKEVKLKSKGFEIETEIVCQALAGGYRVVESPVSYLPRVAGTESKLRAVRDGLRILKMMTIQSLRLKPWRIPSALVVLIVALAIVTGSGLLWILAGTAIGVLTVVNRKTI
ncbi:MAG: glycosyltransferase [Planctomycetota bacterium]|nr:glycosyltransferase [Planctomycetota bacterium]